MLSVKKELKIYRGTYQEISTMTTEDMAIYFSWDTQEIFVGNKYGVKTPYIGGNRLSEREIRDLITSQTDLELETLRSQILSTNIKALSNETDIDALTLRVEAVEGANNDEIVAAVVALLVGEGGALADYYTSEETDGAISTALGNYYTKSQVDNKLPDPALVPNFPNDYIDVKGRISSLEEAENNYNSIKILSASPIDDVELLGYISTVEKGIYSFISNQGHELLINNQSRVLRLKPDGVIYYLSGSSWIIVPIDPAIVKSINGVTAVNGAMNFTTANIIEAPTKVFNNILPQANDVINPLGRGVGTPGVGSISFGKDSVADGVNSIALGYQALADAEDSIQLGTGSNIVAGTLKFMDYELVNASGKVPTERIIDTFGTEEVQIDTLDWNISNEVSVSIAGINDSSLIWVSPTPITTLTSGDNIEVYGRANIRAISQSEGVIVFKCDVKPSVTVSINVIWRSL